VAATWGAMTDGARVEAAPRLAQWRVDALPCYTYRKSLPFHIGLWNWSVSSLAPSLPFHVSLLLSRFVQKVYACYLVLMSDRVQKFQLW